MRTTVKIVLGVVLSGVMFVFAIFVDAMARSQFATPMKIDGLPVSNATVTGVWRPDFLWIGKAWRIDVQTDDDLELKLDGRRYVVPKGSHTVYSNHDHTNTGQYGPQQFWGYPEKVEICTVMETLRKR